MNIGLFFGSFNPIHIGHLIIANHILNETSIEKIWLVVSPQNPFKKSETLLNEYDRLHLVRLAIQDDLRLKALDIEFSLPKPSYTANTLIYLKEKYPENYFSIILGSDSYQNLNKWKNFESIISTYPLFVYKREGFEVNKTISDQTIILDAPIIQISSTQIRNCILNGKSIRYMVPETVKEEIESRKFFLKKDQKI